jgi:hypothetical protein
MTMMRFEPKVSCSRIWVRLILNNYTIDKLLNVMVRIQNITLIVFKLADLSITSCYVISWGLTLRKLERDLKDILKIKWSSQLESIVGITVNRTLDGFILTQPKLIKSLLNTEWNGAITTRTPLPPNFNAVMEIGDPSTSTKYLSIIGVLSYLAVGTRPDISFAVNFLARFLANPSVTHRKGL